LYGEQIGGQLPSKAKKKGQEMRKAEKAEKRGKKQKFFYCGSELKKEGLSTEG
jgi:hypothetical protein